jgi:PilZ domain
MPLESRAVERDQGKKTPRNPLTALPNGPLVFSSAPRDRRLVDKRRESRYPTNDAVEVNILESGGELVAGTVLDVSGRGLRIKLTAPVGNGLRLEIILRDRAIIFGETRYCRGSGDSYHVGVVIEDVYYAQPVFERHIDDDQLSLYLVGKGLGVIEVIHIKRHLFACNDCRRRLAEAKSILETQRKRCPIDADSPGGP